MLTILKRKGPVRAVLYLLMFFTFSCGASETKIEIKKQNPAWSEFISSHTNGAISKRAKILVKFVKPVIDQTIIGQNAGTYIQIIPSAKWSITFSDIDTIVAVPEGDLESGRQYIVTVKGRDFIKDLPPSLDNYVFGVDVIKQDYEVKVAGLKVAQNNAAEMVVDGTILTADTEAPENVEKILAATFANKNLPISWRHDTDGKRHDFSVTGVERQESEVPVNLAWKGTAIGVASSGSASITVPSLNVFKVLEVKVERDADKQYVVAYFSDNISRRQNLGGLIRIGSFAFTTRAEGNTIKIYPGKLFVGDAEIVFENGIQNEQGTRLKERYAQKVRFISQKPQVRFAGKGVILPDNKVLAIPFEAINVNSVQVTAFRVFENNMGQFLQTNNLGGKDELYRVGRYLWRKTLRLSSVELNEWNRYNIDVTDLLRKAPGGLFRITISINRGNSAYGCGDEDNNVPVVAEGLLDNAEDLSGRHESSYWDSSEYYDEDEGYYGSKPKWSDRENPCNDAYYRYGSGVTDSRNFLASNIGLVVKRGERGQLRVAATSISAAEAMKGVNLSFVNFQNQTIKTLVTDGDGFAEAELEETPFYVEAEKDGQKGYLKLTSNIALPTSHFDVSGEKIRAGIKGYIYGERGVWRPGDDIYLTYVLQDKEGVIPPNHPVTMKLFNPKGQLIQRVTNAAPVGGFYAFHLKTADDALTGNWQAKAEVGGSAFSKEIKIETVIPNRLKVELDLDGENLYKSDKPIKGKVSSQWLHGAIAASLKTDVQVKFNAATTKFDRYSDYVFDDPTREYEDEPITVFEGHLDENGKAGFEEDFSSVDNAPGVLSANFTTRVFEEGGAWSSGRMSALYYPYAAFVGIKLPKGDAARNMLLTDKVHVASIAAVNAKGEPIDLKQIEVALYKIDWKWWWDKSGDSLANFANSSYTTVLHKNVISTANGQGSWNFEIKYPDWGRYLVRACDLAGKHCAGKIVYMDWPGWAGRAQEEGGPGANVLTFFSDKQRYNVGETAVIQLPEAIQGRAIVSIENGTRVLEQYWLELKKDGKNRFEMPLRENMSPNIYVSVTLIQPHAGKQNDRPIRLYGIIPILVDDPKTILKPKVKADDEWAPKSKVKVEVSEEKGRVMTYTLAIVDEGLLGLTAFKTPDLHKQFYKKELLGVATWDMYDFVAGAYGAELERLLAIGGDEDFRTDKSEADNKRFPPVVKFLGPFKLGAGKSATHEIELPNYIGAVRVMAVAGENGAYGREEKTVFVREALSLLATLPRVIGPAEEFSVPVSVFVNDGNIKEVSLKVIPDKMFELVGSGTVNLAFSKPGEKIGRVNVKAGNRLGKGKMGFAATGGGKRSESEIYIDIRTPNPPTVESRKKTLQPGESWEENIVPHGLPGTNHVLLEVSSVPPLDLERRLDYLIQYPHGCVEQITSSAFPQLYLPSLVSLDEKRKKDVENNIKLGIDRLRSFQAGNGGFVYWPGANSGEVAPWATNYAGHFLIEAEKLGYYVPPEMLGSWAAYQKSAAQSWQPGYGLTAIDQAYRLYTLALAGTPELGDMNRLKETGKLDSASRWLLAAAYYLAGQHDVAPKIVGDNRMEAANYSSPGYTYGSPLRDRAVILLSLVTMRDYENASDMLKKISQELSGSAWHSTQSVAYSLMAASKYVGGASLKSSFTFERKVAKTVESVHSDSPVYLKPLGAFPQEGAVIGVKNTSKIPITASVVVKGIPNAGSETASSSGLALGVSYTDMKGRPVNENDLAQGTDFKVRIRVGNSTAIPLDNVALTHVVASGWEIRNARFDDGAGTPAGIDYQDVRDDRIYTYFSLKPGETKEFTATLNAAYLGRFYLPGIYVEAMYDAAKNAGIKGQWVTVSNSKN